MEDAHAAVLPLDEEMENLTALFAVYDGHGGTVQWCGPHFSVMQCR